MRKLIILCVSLIVLGFAESKAEDAPRPQGSASAVDFVKVGGAGSGFLKIGVGARASGMGGAHGALVNDLSAIHWNPAGVANIEGISAYAASSPYFSKFNHNFAAASFALDDQFVIAGHFNQFGATGIPITTLINDQGTGATYDIVDMSFGLTFSGYLTEQFAFGITGKYVNNRFRDVSAGNLVFDVGTQYDTGLYGMKIGFSIHNLGGQTQYEGSGLAQTVTLIEGDFAAPSDAEFLSTPYAMPLTFRAGLGATVWEQDEHLINAEADFVTNSDAEPMGAIGAEYVYNEIFAFRAGYTINHSQLGLAVGAGLKYNTGDVMGGLDYSMDMTSAFGLIHRLNVNVQLDN